MHVLGTPPAFTLSQDQTLHHELMLRLIPSGPSIARESPRNLSAKCTPSHCATSDPKQLRDLQHRTSTASHPRRSYSHFFAFLTLIWHASTEIHFVGTVRCHHPARLPASRQPTCRALIADSSLEASLLHSSLVQVHRGSTKSQQKSRLPCGTSGTALGGTG